MVNEKLLLEEVDKIKFNQDLSFGDVVITEKNLLACIEKIKTKDRTGAYVLNKNSGKVGIVLKEFDSGSVQVLESIQPCVINTHDSWDTLIEMPR